MQVRFSELFVLSVELFKHSIGEDVQAVAGTKIHFARCVLCVLCYADDLAGFLKEVQSTVLEQRAGGVPGRNILQALLLRINVNKNRCQKRAEERVSVEECIVEDLHQTLRINFEILQVVVDSFDGHRDECCLDTV